jgi:FAD binding domain
VSRSISFVIYPLTAISIVAGPSGLTLAALLQRHFPNSIAIYESDSSRHSRDQGGTLDLHHDSGQLALKEAGLHEKFLEHARPEGETLRIYSPDGRVLMDESKNGGDGEGGKGERDGEGDKGERGLCREGEVGGSAKRPDYMKGRPEIDRVVLRGMLLDSLAEGTVQWGRRLLKVVEDNGTCTYELHFGDGSVENGFDLVVGADGAWSKVRPLVTDTVPFYSGIQGLDVRVTDVDRRFPELSERVGNGMCLTLGENKAILAQRNGDGCIRVYAFLRATETWQQECGVDWTDMESAKKEVIEKCFGDWDGLAKDLVLKSDPDSACVRQMYMLPVGVRWFGKAG